MEIHWSSAKLKKDLQDGRFLTRSYDEKVAKKVAQRLQEIAAAPSYAQLPPASRPHPIWDGNEFLYYAVDVPGIGEARGKLRLTFTPYGEHDLAHVETITAVVITGLTNYHK